MKYRSATEDTFESIYRNLYKLFKIYYFPLKFPKTFKNLPLSLVYSKTFKHSIIAYPFHGFKVSMISNICNIHERYILKLSDTLCRN